MPGLVELLAKHFQRPISTQVGRTAGSTNTRDTLEDIIYRIGSSRMVPGGREIIPQDRIYLRQFLNPSKDIIPKTSLRPSTKVKDSDKYDWRTVPDAPGEWDDIVMPNVFGLGNFRQTTNVGSSVSEDLPYSSIYDLWDFDSPNVSPMVRVLMNSIGRPFHVYKRSYDPRIASR